VTPLDIAIVTAAVAVGAAVQASVGFGLGLIAAPVVALVDTRLVPGPMLFAAVPLTVVVVLHERGSLDVGGIRWAVVGRIPGTLLGVYAVALLPERALVVVFCLAILTGVVLSVVGWHLHPKPGTLLGAGLASGFMGTVTSIGGPPMALVYQRDAGARLRSTLAVYFMVGAMFSLLMLVVAGQFGPTDLGLGLLLLPGAALGFAASRLVAPWLDRGYTRWAVLGFSAASSLFLLGRELL
jgi:uncharacterized membrane protein YfcA